MTPRIYREYKNLADLNVGQLGHQKVAYLQFSEEQQREIVFKDITTGEVTHTTILDTLANIDSSSVIGYFAHAIMRELRLVSGYDVLYEKVKEFVRDHLFVEPVDLVSANTLRNLSEIVASKTLIETIKKAINELTIHDRGDAEIKDMIKLKQTRPFVVKNQEYYVPTKSPFNRIVGDAHFELEFAKFLDDCDDVRSFAKNYFAVHFKLDYVKADGNISTYTPDYLVKLSQTEICVVETKGREDIDVPLKMARLKQWCADVNAAQNRVKYSFVYVDYDDFKKYHPKNFADLVKSFMEYQ